MIRAFSRFAKRVCTARGHWRSGCSAGIALLAALAAFPATAAEYPGAGPERRRRDAALYRPGRRGFRRHRAAFRYRLHGAGDRQSRRRSLAPRRRARDHDTGAPYHARWAAPGRRHQPGAMAAVLFPAGRRPGRNLPAGARRHRPQDAARHHAGRQQRGEPGLVSAALDSRRAARIAGRRAGGAG